MRMRRGLGAAVLAAVLAVAASAAPGAQRGAAMSGASDDELTGQRERMVEEQIRRRGINDPRLLAALRRVPRHVFVDPATRADAYADHPLPIGWGQTISQPYVVALMTQHLDLDGTERVLEIGTGSGYQAAILAELAREVYSIEILEPLGRQAEATLAGLGYDKVKVRIGDGYKGWPEAAPFDAIIVTAAPPRIPQPLIDQLKVGGRLVIPVGSFFQSLQVITRTRDGITTRSVAPVRFVPMTGEVEKRKE